MADFNSTERVLKFGAPYILTQQSDGYVNYENESIIKKKKIIQ